MIIYKLGSTRALTKADDSVQENPVFKLRTVDSEAQILEALPSDDTEQRGDKRPHELSDECLQTDTQHEGGGYADEITP